MSKVSHSASSSCATSLFHLKTSIVVDCFGISISNFPPAAAWDDGSVFQIRRAKAPVNILLVSKVTQLVVDIAIRQVQKGVFVEKGFLRGVTGQHQLLKPMGGCDALPFFLQQQSWSRYFCVGWHLPQQHHLWQSGEEAPCLRGCPSSCSSLSWFLLDSRVQQLPASQNFTGWLCNNNSQDKLKKTAFAASSNCRENLQQ